MSGEKKPLLVIAGPTASGKTALAAECALRLGGEAVSADSMQIYRGMDIGTAKPTEEERRGVAHHMLDVADPKESYSAARFTTEANKCIADIHSRGKLPILVGGTGLYIDGVVGRAVFSAMPADEEYRATLSAEEEKRGRDWLRELLREVDPESYERICPADKKRIIRALEVFRATGETIGEHNRRSREYPAPYRASFFVISPDRAELYARINARADAMFERGLAEETEALLRGGVPREATSMQAIGYKETAAYLEGECSLTEAREAVKLHSRRYAKRQITWFKRVESAIYMGSAEEMLQKHYGTITF